ncbi:MAG TPA: Gfo/Idh/MocA family oxidoreductase [Anaerolineales bacterium]|nr:Gfo/Idh/MocA family oxidoreductase [Anaerolineales bacterium]
MTTKILNWGLLSTAWINRLLIPPLQVSKRNHLLAVASRTQASADAYAKEKRIERAHGSYEALVADPDIHVIYNPLPNHLHAEWTIKAVETGKHVLCEKPIALNVGEVDAIMSAARKHGRVVTEAFMYRHHPQTLKVQEMVRNGSLGALKLIRGSFSFKLDDAKNIRLIPEWGGGSIWDVGCYPISYVRTVLRANPVEVFGWQVTGPTGIDNTFVGQMKFEGDVHAQFDSSFDIPFHTFMEVVGSEATLSIPKPFKPGVKEQIFITRDDKTEAIKIKGQELYLGEVEDIADAILEGKDTLISLRDSRENIAVISALLESARIGKPVTVVY